MTRLGNDGTTRTINFLGGSQIIWDVRKQASVNTYTLGKQWIQESARAQRYGKEWQCAQTNMHTRECAQQLYRLNYDNLLTPPHPLNNNTIYTTNTLLKGNVQEDLVLDKLLTAPLPSIEPPLRDQQLTRFEHTVASSLILDIPVMKAVLSEKLVSKDTS